MSETPQRDIWTVSRLNREARMLVETGIGVLWLEGELSNLAQPGSGHIYFTLKDSAAQIRCAMFKPRRQLVRFRPADGLQVLVRGRVSVYEPRGDFQFIVEHMEESGSGALQRAFEELKTRLAAEGLFDESTKRPLPALPRCIGVVTSPTGAAIRDILSVVGRRFPAIPVIVYPVPVQGEGAAERIIAMLDIVRARAECDVVILARGGGSMEDLWAFNDERLARALRAFPVPVVTGIGHEIDFTIADLAADRRAPTPSAAAELVVPDGNALGARFAAMSRMLDQAFARGLAARREHLRWLGARLLPMHPGRRLQQQAQRLDELEQRTARAWGRLVERAASRLASAARALNSISPLATLGRGYAIITRMDGTQPVIDAGALKAGDRLEARFARGRAALIVDAITDRGGGK